LYFHGNTEHFYIDSYICANNNKKEMYYCISMATLNTFILTATPVLTTIKRNVLLYFHGNTEHFYIDSYTCTNNNKKKRIVVIPWQH